MAFTETPCFLKEAATASLTQPCQATSTRAVQYPVSVPPALSIYGTESTL